MAVVTGATGSFLRLSVATYATPVPGQDYATSRDKAGSGDNVEITAREDGYILLRKSLLFSPYFSL